MTAPTLARESAATRLNVEFRTISMVWRRELIRFLRSGPRVVTGFVQPILFLFVLGAGLSPLVGSTSGLDFKKFVFPGVVAMSVITTALFSAISIVWDREFGFLREMLVAPVSRSSLVLGKAMGGATVATIQGAVMLVLAPLIGVRLTPLVVIEVLGIAFLMAFALTGFGVFVASRVTKMENFQVVMQFLMFPMLFLSGALFPVNGLPHWLTFLTRIDPLTYAIDPLRRVVFAAQDVPAAALERFGTGVELLGHRLSIVTDLLIVAAFALCFLLVAIRSFGRPE
ncbi:MAG: ABC transporter permease subunit [Actinobacteria bacterium]|nr:ABC transporter permease subunit [Actinomycetota bacterium]